jgi:hypothetical protein
MSVITAHRAGYRQGMRFIALTLTALAAAAVLASSALAAPQLSVSERKAINRAVDTFVLHAVRHENARAAYDVVSPTFRAGLSRTEFNRKDPAYPFPARGKHFQWSLDYVQPNEVGASILLQPEKRFIRKKGPILFDLIVIRHKGHWVIQSLIPKVIFGTPYKPKVVSVRDYSPTGAGNAQTYSKNRINGDYIVIPFALFGALLAGLVGWGVLRWYRDRRIDLESVRARAARARALTATRPSVK